MLIDHHSGQRLSTHRKIRERHADEAVMRPDIAPYDCGARGGAKKLRRDEFDRR
jgi:hypothetical protein